MIKFILVENSEQFFSAHLLWISTDGTEDLQEPCTLVILGGSNVLEVIQRPVEDVAVEVIHYMTGRYLSQPRECHQHMDTSVTEIMLQLRIVRMGIPFALEMSVGIGLNLFQLTGCVGEE